MDRQRIADSLYIFYNIKYQRRKKRLQYLKQYRTGNDYHLQREAWLTKHPHYYRSWILNHSDYHRCWRQNNRSHYDTYQKQWYRNHRERRKTYMREYMHKCRTRTC